MKANQKGLKAYKGELKRRMQTRFRKKQTQTREGYKKYENQSRKMQTKFRQNSNHRPRRERKQSSKEKCKQRDKVGCGCKLKSGMEGEAKYEEMETKE